MSDATRGYVAAVYEPEILAFVIVVAGLAYVRRAAIPEIYLLGVALAGATVLPPLDAWGMRSLAGHMVQHLLHTDVVPPLIFLGAPVLTRPFRRIPAPVSLFAALALVWGIHLSPLFEASLEHAWTHAAVHLLFLLSGALMWAPVFDPERLSSIARVGYVFLAMPLTGLLGFVLFSSRLPMYAHYLAVCGGRALADQQTGGEVMWIGGSAIMFIGFMLVAAEFARHESRIARENLE